MPSLVILRAIIPQATATISDYITIEENPHDVSRGTMHPVDSGAIMSDHIILMPPEVKLRLGWTQAQEGPGGPGTISSSYVRDKYAEILALKNSRELFTVFTGKRIYNNMYAADISGPITDRRFEWSMIVDILLRQMLLVNLQAPSGAPSQTTTGANPQPSEQAEPQATQPTTAAGAAQPAQINGLTSGSGPTQIPTGGIADEGPSLNAESELGPSNVTTISNLPNSNSGGTGGTRDFFQGAF